MDKKELLFKDDHRSGQNVNPSPASETRRYLRVLGASQATSLFWVTLDDLRLRRDLTLTLNAPLEHAEARLRSLNDAGAGIFVCIGRVQGPEPLKRNVERIDVLVLDLDGTPLPTSFGPLPEPHMVIETSPQRWHCYWMVYDVPLGAFPIAQRKLAMAFDGDACISRVEQIIRVPGFLHQKKTPFRSRITHDRTTEPRLRFADMALALSRFDSEASSPNIPPLAWIRDRQTGAILDEDFLTHAVWTEVLALRSNDVDEIASRAWQRCEAEVDVARLGDRCTRHMATILASRALKALA